MNYSTTMGEYLRQTDPRSADYIKTLCNAPNIHARQPADRHYRPTIAMVSSGIEMLMEPPGNQRIPHQRTIDPLMQIHQVFDRMTRPDVMID